MNRTDRMLAMVLELQERRRCRAEDLAETFEISKRTVYRDIQALCEAGVPIIAMPGEGYSLAEGYFLPPLSFSADEGAMLMLGSDVMAQNFDSEYRAAAQLAGRKIAAVLPDKLREDVDNLRESVRFLSVYKTDGTNLESTLQQVRRATIRRQTVRFKYHARRGESGTRDADPYGLVHVTGTWLMIAYCHVRNDLRTFRLSRMEDLTVLPRQFERKGNFNMHKYTAKHREIAPEERLIVKVLAAPEIARWVQESYPFFMLEAQDMPEGLLLTLGVREERDVLQWVLGWGQHIRVLEPPSLRRLVAEEAKALWEKHRDA